MSRAIPDPTHAALDPPRRPYRISPVFTETTVPPGLLRSHRTARGVWALVRVMDGRLLYRVLDPYAERVLDPQSAPGLVEPDVPHEVGLLGAVRFQVEFYRLPATSSAGTAKQGE